MNSLFLSFVSCCLLDLVTGDSGNDTFTDGSSSCSAISDASALLQSRLEVVGDAARMNASDGVGDTVRHGFGIVTDLQKTGGPVSPLISCGKTFYVLGRSDVWNGNCFCYKLVMCDVLYQHQPIVNCDTYSNERCATAEKDWTPEDSKGFWPPLPSSDYWNTVIGQHPATAANGLTQKYSDGTQKRSCDTDDKKRETSLKMVVDDSKTEVNMLVTEPDLRCSYHVELVGPLKIFGAATTTTTTTTTTVTDGPGPIPPSRSCGQTFYILGQSDVWGGNCFCYKLVMCNILYQHQPTVGCGTYSNEKCATAEKDWTPEDAKGFWPPLPSDDYWNTVIGKYAEDSEDGMTQSYTDGTAKSSCDTDDEKRRTALTMKVDNSKKDLSVSVTEPIDRCSYEAKVIGPVSKLTGHR